MDLGILLNIGNLGRARVSTDILYAISWSEELAVDKRNHVLAVGYEVIDTHIWVTADLLDDILIKVSGVSHKPTSDVESMFKAPEGHDRCLGPLLKTPLGLRTLVMLLLNPLMVHSGGRVG